jgi:membrane protein insertase Oxa1/YidC/SpoIIIJ
MIRAVSSLRYLQRGPGSKTLSSFRIHHLNDSRQSGIGNTTGSVYYSPPLARSFSSTTTNCQEEKSLSDATPAAPPSFDETMSKLFLESSEKVQAVGEVAAAAVWEPTWWPSDQIILLLNFIQETTGTPLAVTIIGTTISMRFLLFPLFVKSQRNQSRMAHMSPELNLLKAKVDAKGKSISQEDQIKMANQMKALFAKYEVNPAMGLMIPLVQMPIFM